MAGSIKRKKPYRFILSLIPILLFIVSLGVISNLLRHVHLEEMKEQIASIPPTRAFLALLLTAAGYFILTLYDVLALKTIGKPLSYRKTAEASFISTAISYNVGMTLLSSGSLRFRIYSRHGLLPIDVGRIIPFCSITFWLGFLFLGSGIFTFGEAALPDHIPLAPWLIHLIGEVMFLIIVAYIILVFRNKNFSIGNFTIPLPRPPVALLQLILGTADWILTVGVLYVIIPPADKGRNGMTDSMSVVFPTPGRPVIIILALLVMVPYFICCYLSSEGTRSKQDIDVRLGQISVQCEISGDLLT